MRPSLQKTTVAALRAEIGLSVEAFAKLIGKSVPTIRSLESGRLKLGEETALKISDQTGISARWLLEGDLTKPMVTSESFWGEDGEPEPYDRDAFAFVRAFPQPDSRAGYLRGQRTRKREAYSAQLCSEWFGIMKAARKDGKAEIAEYLLGEFMKEMKERFGYDPAGKRRSLS
jgi:transcriptional regulator with XRE-family HTH domain